MRNALYLLAGVFAVSAAAVMMAADHSAADEGGVAAKMVMPDGSIVMTKDDYRRNWATLGVWAHMGDDGVEQFNTVFTQPETVTAYRATGEFPEGAVLIKELREAVTKGEKGKEVSSYGDLKGWFVLIKPSKEGGPEGPLWGDGWGWAKFNADAPDKTITTNYRTDCIQCHMPAKDTDWVFVNGYPMLHD